MEAISREFRVALPWELLYADVLTVIAETEEELIKRLNEWKDNVESKGMNSGLCDPDHMSLEDSVTDADDKLFNLILYIKHHVLHSILPDRSDFNYNLRPRRHNLVLTAKSSSITDRDYITRMIFKNIY